MIRRVVILVSWVLRKIMRPAMSVDDGSQGGATAPDAYCLRGPSEVPAPPTDAFTD